VIVLDTLLIGGIRFVLGKIAAAVEAEMDDDSRLREELLAAQMRLELGEIDEATYAEQERELLARINEVRARRTGGAAAGGGAFRVTGIEATIVGEEGSEEVATTTPSRRRRRR
jgi:Gas vesicle protein G